MPQPVCWFRTLFPAPTCRSGHSKVGSGSGTASAEAGVAPARLDFLYSCSWWLCGARSDGKHA